MRGFVVLRSLAELESIAATVDVLNPPEQALALACRAHYPDETTQLGALMRVQFDWNDFVIIAAGDALQRIRVFVEQRRAATERRQKSAPFRNRARAKR